MTQSFRDPHLDLWDFYKSHLVHKIEVPDRQGKLILRRRAGKKTLGLFQNALGDFLASREAWNSLSVMPLHRIWVWSDHHLNHENIMRLCGRTQEPIASMNARLLDAAQSVPPDDALIFVGDLVVRDMEGVAQWLSRCPGRKFIIIGNHDGMLRPMWRELGFEGAAPCWVQDLAPYPSSPLIRAPVKSLWWTHYPLGPTLPSGILNIHGHIHNRTLAGPRINVSVEALGMAPRRLIDCISGVTHPESLQY